MADIQILMMGGRRTGKSSVLASMVKQLEEDEKINNYVYITSERVLSDAEIVKTLPDKRNDLESFLSNPKGNNYIVDFDPDKHFTYYLFKTKIPNCSGNIDVTFVDCPGESFGQNSRPDLYQKICDAMPTTDIFVIVVDTPYLMDEGSDTGKFKKINSCSEITALFRQYVDFKNQYDYKKIIFVPVKCEAWRDRLDEVSSKLQEKSYYGPLFSLIEKEPRWSCCIIPALTAGGITFAEFGEPKLLDGVECSPLGTKKVRMKNGFTRTLKTDEKPIDNKEFKVHFPFYSWFRNTGVYQPENCDQVALHVSRFIVFKTLVERGTGFGRWIPNFLAGFPSNSNLKKMILNLEDNGLLKDGNPQSQSVDKAIVNVRKIETRAEMNKY